jgi:hypothetical protein
MVVKVGGDNVALGYADLLSARFDDRVHNHETLSGHPYAVNENRVSPLTDLREKCRFLI